MHANEPIAITPAAAFLDVLDRLVRIGGAPIRPVAHLVIQLLERQRFDDFRRHLIVRHAHRLGASPRTIEREQDDIDPFLKIVRRASDLAQLFEDVRRNAVGARAWPERRARECALPE
jgi:hypothetical protein